MAISRTCNKTNAHICSFYCLKGGVGELGYLLTRGLEVGGGIRGFGELGGVELRLVCESVISELTDDDDSKS